MSQTHPDLARTWQVRVSSFCLIAAICCGCQQSPEGFVQRFTQAIEVGDDAQIKSMLTPASATLYEALPASMTKAPPATDKVTVLEVSKIHDGVAVRIRDERSEATWVLRSAGRSWRLDLLATANQRIYDTP